MAPTTIPSPSSSITSTGVSPVWKFIPRPPETVLFSTRAVHSTWLLDQSMSERIGPVSVMRNSNGPVSSVLRAKLTLCEPAPEIDGIVVEEVNSQPRSV